MRIRPMLPGKVLLFIGLIGLGLAFGRSAVEQANANESADAAEKADVPAVLDFEMQTIDGDEIRLDKYHGDVILIVNVASKCGLTPQYEQLQSLHEEYADAGLSILGFPANNFRNQEPGSNGDIAVFCQENYGVEFDLFAKLSVEGEDQAPLYKFLTSKETNPDFAGKIRWNFDKFLISREGEVIARFAPKTKPGAKEIVQAIKDALDKPVPESVKEKSAKKAAE